MAAVFVSYARKDREAVLPWVDALERAGVSVWRDEAGIAGARLWGQEIAEAIEACTVLILMLSTTSAASQQVVREVTLASEGDRPILPLLLEPVTIPTALRYHLAGIQQIELFRGEREETLPAILRSLAQFGVQAEAARPAAAPESPSHNLPRQLTRFIGRERETAEVKELLAGTCLLTLTGPGGCGKTRLSLQVAGDLLEEYADGVWQVELEALADPALVPQSVASVLGVGEQPERPLVETLLEFLRPRSLLLVLDNCEHLVAACAALSQTLLRACPNLRILATSREALGIPGEVTWPVSSLSRPDPQRLPASGPGLVSALTAHEAVQLFADRALLSQPGFAVTERNAQAVAQICWRLDGIPLAIELAASRVKLLPVEQIVARLNDRFRLLTGGSRTALPRQQTLRALIDWSYDLLSEPERLLLRRLAVFAGGFTLDAAEAVCAGAGLEAGDVLDRLGQLVEKSLVMMEAPGDEVRYRLLETIRQYGDEKLRETGEEPLVRARHQDAFLQLAEQAAPHLTGAEQAIWLERLEREHDNLRAALGGAVNAGAAELGMRLASALWRFWHVRGYLSEGRSHLDAVLALPMSDACAPTRARALNAAGALAHDQGDYARAIALHEESLAMARACGDKESIAFALNNLGNVALDGGNDEQAACHYQEALALWRELGNRQGISVLLNNLGSVARDRGETAEAVAFFEESLALKRGLGDQRGIANSLNNLALLAIAQGSHDRAASLLDESLQLYRSLGDSNGIAMSLNNLANLAFVQGDRARSAELYRDCLTMFASLGNRHAIAEALEGLAAVLAAPGTLLEAARLYGAAAALRDALGAPLPPTERDHCERAVAAVRAGLGEDAFAEAWAAGRRMTLEQAIALALEIRVAVP